LGGEFPVQIPTLFDEHKDVACQGGEAASNVRLELEAKTGKKIVTPLNAKDGILLRGDNDGKLK